MTTQFAKSIHNIWDDWHIRGFMVLSLSLQTLLILQAPFRKRIANIFVNSLLWAAYLLAEFAATYAVGQISQSQTRNQMEHTSTSKNSSTDGDLLVFWAPFLLLHLGGPDTITALALEDNSLWLRSFISFVFQLVSAIYIFILSLPKNKLLVSISFMFLAGIIKYVERVRALYLASLERFRDSLLDEPDPGPNYAKLMDEYSSMKNANLPARIKLTKERDKSEAAIKEILRRHHPRTNPNLPIGGIEAIQHAFRFFETFKGLIVDHIFSFHERNISWLFFYQRTSEDALKIISIELNFIYEVLYTKVKAVRTRWGYFFRFLSFSAIIVALACFISLEKHGFYSIDIAITYTLLYGAIALDMVALFMQLSSDWTVVATTKISDQQKQIISSDEESQNENKKKNYGIAIVEKYLYLKRPNWDTETTTTMERVRQILFRRWSESVYAFNLIDYCMKERTKQNLLWLKVIDSFGLKNFRDKMKYVSSKPLSQDLWNFIFEQLKIKSEDNLKRPKKAKEICAARGEWVLDKNKWKAECSGIKDSYIVKVDYDQSLMLWHIATEICYNLDKDYNSEDSEICHRKLSKILSDYMLYLLVMQQNIMSSISGIGKIRFRDTCAEAKQFFDKRDLGQGVPEPQQQQQHQNRAKRNEKQELYKEACKIIYEVDTKGAKPSDVKGDRSKSVLFDACILAKELMVKFKKNKWELLSEVWVELLSYAAIHSRPDTHAQSLSKGGELVSLLWLLMAHLGIGEQFQINKGHARAKLIVRK